VTSGRRIAKVLGAAVHVGGDHVGRVTGVLVRSPGEAIGLEVTSPDLSRSFLPLVAATLVDDVVDVRSPLLLVESCDAYIERGATVCRESAELDWSFAAGDVSPAVQVGTRPR
jgi:hypothetical protein